MTPAMAKRVRGRVVTQTWQDQIRAMAPKGLGWIEPPGMKAYVRVTERQIRDTIIPTIDLASMDAHIRGQGTLTAWLWEVKTLAWEMRRAIYVESVINQRLVTWFERQGFFIVADDKVISCLVWDAPVRNADLNTLLVRAQAQMQAPEVTQGRDT